MPPPSVISPLTPALALNDPVLLWLGIVSHFIIWAMQLTLAGSVLFITHRMGRDLPFRHVLLWVAMFSACCAFTHFFAIQNLLSPDYWLAVVECLLTAVVSVGLGLVLTTQAKPITRTLLQAREWQLQSEELDHTQQQLVALTKVEADLHDTWRRIMDALPGIIFTTDDSGGFTYVSPEWAHWTGQPTTAALGWGWQETVHPSDRSALLARWAHSLATGEPYEAEFRLHTPGVENDGWAGDGWTWHISRARHIAASNGASYGWTGYCINIDALKQSEFERLHPRLADLASKPGTGRRSEIGGRQDQATTPPQAAAGGAGPGDGGSPGNTKGGG